MYMLPVTKTQAIEGYRKALRMLESCKNLADIEKVKPYIDIVSKQLDDIKYEDDLYAKLFIATSIASFNK